MKLDFDCARDILVWMQDNHYRDDEENKRVVMQTLYKALEPKYLEQDIFYATCKLFEADFLDGDISFLPNGGLRYCKITDVTYKGHEFVEATRNPTIWEEVKSRMSKVGGMSLSLAGSIAAEIFKGKVLHIV